MNDITFEVWARSLNGIYDSSTFFCCMYGNEDIRSEGNKCSPFEGVSTTHVLFEGTVNYSVKAFCVIDKFDGYDVI